MKHRRETRREERRALQRGEEKRREEEKGRKRRGEERGQRTEGKEQQTENSVDFVVCVGASLFTCCVFAASCFVLSLVFLLLAPLRSCCGGFVVVLLGRLVVCVGCCLHAWSFGGLVACSVGLQMGLCACGLVCRVVRLRGSCVALLYELSLIHI